MCMDAPDTGPQERLADQNAEIAREQLGLAREQWGVAKERQAKFDPQFQAIIDQALTSQRTQDMRSDALFKEWSDSADVRRMMFDTAREYDTPGRRDEAAAAARATVDTQFAANRESQKRALSRAGVGVTAGRALTLDNASRFAASKAAAGADITARRNVEATGMSLVDNAAKTSMGLPSTGLQAAGLALNAGGAGAGTLGQQQGTFNASVAPSMGLFHGATGAGNSAANIYNNAAALQQQGNAGFMSGLMGIGQTAGIMYGSGMISSKKRKKPVGRRTPAPEVEDARIVSETPTSDRMAPMTLEAWRYKDGQGPDTDVHVGEYSEETRAQFGDGVAPGGEVIDIGAAAARNAQAIAELGRMLKRMERQVTELGVA